jgi:monofunctional biosynthetic peptidoglycan transglycosylase
MFGLSLFTAIACFAMVWFGWSYFRSEFPDVTLLRTQYPVVHYQGKDQAPRITLQKSRPMSWVSLEEVSRFALGAIIVSEDWAFYQHKGYDAAQIKEAMQEDWEAGHFVRGASTITQQVVRNVFLDKDKNLWRKLKELILAVRIEETVGKRKILESYLNVAEWGEGIYGVGEAARVYFGKTPAELTPKEGAFLAMLLPSPKRYSQSFRAKRLTDYARETVASILGKMTQARYITEEQRDHELSTPLSFEAPVSNLPSPDAL